MGEDGPGRPWDDGLQNERTSLAWARSTLALLGAALVVARIAFDTHPVLGATLAVAAVLLAGWSFRLASLRYRRAAESLHTGRPLPDGRLPAAVTALAVLIGLIGLGLVLLPATG